VSYVTLDILSAWMSVCCARCLVNRDRAQRGPMAREAFAASARRGWVGVDLDGTLAAYDGWVGVDHIGAPIPRMVERVRGWLAVGQDVRIMTARVSHNGSAEQMLSAQMAMVHIMDWCATHLGKPLPVTCVKDYAMVELWDDRAVQVIPNTGLRADGQDAAQGAA
jgi:hypothetical protein